MTYAELRTAVEESINAVPFVPPVSVDYCTAVRDALRLKAPGAVLDAFYRGQSPHTELVVGARSGAVRYELVVALG